MTTDKHPDDLRLDKEYEQINHPNGVTTWKTKPKVKPEALRLAEQLDSEWPEDCEIHGAADELRRLHQHEVAHSEWLDKTEWVQDTAHYSELGEHRADVIRKRFDRLHALNQELLEALQKIKHHFDTDEYAWEVATAAIVKAQGASNE